ncbi:MAG: 30S ribosomal protein S1 [Anaerolineales bacterium]|nr:30S ribosomal protein S1 [Anaerolineales bacterium]
MVQKNHRNPDMGGPPPVDDSWWTAILEDIEQQFAPAQPAGRSQLNPTAETSTPPDPEKQEVDWGYAEQLYSQDQVIDLVVSGYNRGGLLVDGRRIQGFVPVSHLVAKAKDRPNQDPETDLEHYLGSTLHLKVIECNPERGRVVLSERAAQTNSGRRNELLESLQEGDCIIGRVTTITDFGTFVDLGGVEGLIHISELSWGRVCHPSDVVTIGQELEVCVLSIDHERARVALSLKRMAPNPWETIHNRYCCGQIAPAVITSVVHFGAFARLEEGLDGLIHVSELRQNGDDVQAEDLVYEGQQVQVRILNIDAQRQRLGLSLYEGEEN